MSNLRRLKRGYVTGLLEFATPQHCFDTGVAEEQVRFSCVEDALLAMLDESILAGCGDAVAYLKSEQLFLTLKAYRRMEVSSNQRDDWAEGQVEWMRDVFQEEYGNEFGDDGLSDEHVTELTARMRGLVDWYLQHAVVYPCEEVRSWTFDKDDLAELVEVFRPEWLRRK